MVQQLMPRGSGLPRTLLALLVCTTLCLGVAGADGSEWSWSNENWRRKVSDVAGQWGRAADKVVDEFADRMHKSAETLADFVSDLKDESNVALCKQCSSFQKCLDDAQSLRDKISMLNSTCRGDANAQSLWKEVQALTNKTKELQLALSVEKMRSQEEMFRCETRTKKLRLNEEKESMRKEMQQEKDRTGKKKVDNGDSDEDRDDEKRVKKLKAKVKSMGEEKTQLEEKIERLERELARKDKMIQFFEDSGEEEEEEEEEDLDLRSKNKKKQHSNKGEGRRKKHKEGKGQKNPGNSKGNKNNGRCAHVWKVVAEKDEELQRHVRGDVDARNEQVCDSSRSDSGPASQPLDTEHWFMTGALLCAVLSFLLFFGFFIWCMISGVTKQLRKEGVGEGREVVEAARKFVRRRARVLELKGQLGLEENAERERMIALQARIKVLHMKSEKAASALAMQVEAANARGGGGKKAGVDEEDEEGEEGGLRAEQGGESSVMAGSAVVVEAEQEKADPPAAGAFGERKDKAAASAASMQSSRFSEDGECREWVGSGTMSEEAVQSAEEEEAGPERERARCLEEVRGRGEEQAAKAESSAASPSLAPSIASAASAERVASASISRVQGTLAMLFPALRGAEEEGEEEEEERRRRMDESTMANGWSIIDGDEY